MAVENNMDALVALCKRRGFVYPASEIYGGINGFWDYGPLGVQLKNNLRDHWWRCMVECPPIGPDGHPLQLVGLDTSIIQNPKTWVASGHVGGFNDPMVDCRECKARYRADKVFYVYVFSEACSRVLKDDMSIYLNRDPGCEGDVEVVLAAAAEADSIEQAGDFGPEAIRQAAKSNNIGNFKKCDAPEDVNILDGMATFLLKDKNGLDFLTVVMPATKAAGQPHPCPRCGAKDSLTEPRLFNLMFETFVGAIRNDDAKAYLRPETAQGIFLNFKNVVDTMRVKMPFGIAQIGKAFRNEVTPRNFVFRSREFEQMELEWFCPPEEALKWYEFWKDQRMKWWQGMGISPANLRLRDHDADELAHYSKACVDVEYKYPFTAPDYGELEGIAHRGAFDLTQHQEHSKIKLEYFDQDRNERYVPHVIEPSSGLTRGALVLLCEAYTPDETRPSQVYMKFDPKFAPIKAGILPLVAKDGMPEIAEKLYLDLRESFIVELDVKQSIGKRYARQDEIGTPYCFTIDGQTKEDQTVTVRYRDTQQQERINISQVKSFLSEKIGTR